MANVTTVKPTREGRRREALHAIPLPLALLGALILARLALAGWWLITDDGVVDTESGRHLQRAWDGYVATGDHAFWFFQAATDYPPLHYLVGAIGALVGGLSADSFMAAQDLFMIPALALGCYGAGSVAYGRTAGVLAAVFALGAPMVVSVFHMFLIDTTEMAMVAVSLWAILASDRFSRVGVSALAGVAVGLGMLAKQNFPLFIAGLLLIVVVRGGWRNWRGLLTFAAVAALLAASWYWSELGRTFQLIHGSSAAASATAGSVSPTADRWTAKNFGFYLWHLANLVVLSPLALAAAGGAVALLVRWLRNRARSDMTPELVAGALVAYAGLSWIYLKDPRYALPMVPYLAVLGTGWIPLLRTRWRTVAIGAISGVALLNVVMTLWGSGEPGKLFVAGAPGQSQGRQLTFWLPQGWIAGRPEHSGAVLAVMRAAAADPSIDKIAFDPGAAGVNFNHPGLDIVSREAKIPIAIPYDIHDPRQVMIANRYPLLPGSPPCGILDGGTGIYLSRGDFAVPFEQRRFYCPPGSPAR